MRVKVFMARYTAGRCAICDEPIHECDEVCYYDDELCHDYCAEDAGAELYSDE